MRNIVWLVLFSSVTVVSAQNETFSEYRVDSFQVDGHSAMVVVPHVKSVSGNWIWRARFWGHEGQTDIALLEKGFHVAYIDVAGLFGNKEEVERWNGFYEYVVDRYQLNEKVALEAMSRGGLIAYNWAAENTEKVACIYADAPVCDIKSWPGGMYNGVGADAEWQACMRVHGINSKTAGEYEMIPLRTAITVAEAGIPALHVCGAADEVVPYEENTGLLVAAYEKAGGSIEVILKEGLGHHPHSLEDPKPIVDFILRHYPVGAWRDLIDEDLSDWDIFMGAPHTETEIEGYKKYDDVRIGDPIGLNTDPNNVFSVVEMDGKQVLKITGEIFAGLVTKEEFEDYHLKLKFKWGDKKWPPRKDLKRNSGVLYHSVGEYTDFWNVWMTSLECEVQQTDCGDFITIGEGTVKAKTAAVKEDGRYFFQHDAELVDMCWSDECPDGRTYKRGDPELVHGKWNEMELICLGSTSVHVLNGEVVMVVYEPVTNISGEWLPMVNGKIQLQSEAAEIYYKDMEIRSVVEFPDDVRKWVQGL